jgi:hypothetical protein
VEAILVEAAQAERLQCGHAVEGGAARADLPDRPPPSRLDWECSKVGRHGLTAEHPPPVGQHLPGYRSVVDAEIAQDASRHDAAVLGGLLADEAPPARGSR